MSEWVPKGMVWLLSGLLVGFIVLAGVTGLWAAEAAYVNRLGMRFIKIPAGSFMMGSHEAAVAVAANPAYCDKPGKAKWFEDEHPLHRVTISKPFLLQETEVTIAQFRTFAKNSGYRSDAEREGWGWSYDSEKEK